MVDSSFTQFLGTNYAATDHEILEIEKLIAEPTRQLCSIEAEITDLQKAIDKLEEKLLPPYAYVDGYKALTSPIRRMPPDVLSEIFIACLPAHRNCIMSASEAPVLLGRICSSWRALSLATPRLWASLHIVEPTRTPYGGFPDVAAKRAQRLETMRTWLGRSGQCPLSISVHSGGSYHSPVDSPATESAEEDDPIIEQLILFASRWQRVCFVHPFRTIQALAHLKGEDVPLLDKIEVVLNDGGSPESPAAPSSLRWPYFELLECPLITSFSTNGRHFGNPDAIPLRWGHLEEVSIGGSAYQSALEGSQALQLLSQCNRLRTCKLVVNMMVMHPIPIGHALVELPLLRTLQLNLLGRPLSALLDRVSAPELRTLVLRGDGEGIPSFLSSCSRLEHLAIGICDGEASDLSDSLRILPPTMLHISLHDTRYHSPPAKPLDDSILAILAQNCPALETLEIGPNSNISDAALEQFVIQRMAMSEAPSLQRVGVVFGRPMKYAIKPRLKQFTESGLELDLSYGEESDLDDWSPLYGLDDGLPRSRTMWWSFPVW
ncbi:hypothetical protein R3P38DRAFT_2666352 [Favolaschia claudopus]|uniref:F-box domain-containing protein n=1 Tax=Favolaschia claudopus TaxID=2862362 RepID=A0AAV9ZC49_9AGAR